MHHELGQVILRNPEPFDLEALYRFKNDQEIAHMLVGFTTGYSMEDLREWLESHRRQKDEVLWVIAETVANTCVGHVGLYQIDFRAGVAELGILIGDRAYWGRGLGRACVEYVLLYGFCELHLNRISLPVLATNERAIKLYRSCGFKDEGRLREGQYKNGEYVDVLLMGLLRREFNAV